MIIAREGRRRCTMPVTPTTPRWSRARRRRSQQHSAHTAHRARSHQRPHASPTGHQRLRRPRAAAGGALRVRLPPMRHPVPRVRVPRHLAAHRGTATPRANLPPGRPRAALAPSLRTPPCDHECAAQVGAFTLRRCRRCAPAAADTNTVDEFACGGVEACGCVPRAVLCRVPACGGESSLCLAQHAHDSHSGLAFTSHDVVVTAPSLHAAAAGAGRRRSCLHPTHDPTTSVL